MVIRDHPEPNTNGILRGCLVSRLEYHHWLPSRTTTRTVAHRYSLWKHDCFNMSHDDVNINARSADPDANTLPQQPPAKKTGTKARSAVATQLVRVHTCKGRGNLSRPPRLHATPQSHKHLQELLPGNQLPAPTAGIMPTAPALRDCPITLAYHCRSAFQAQHQVPRSSGTIGQVNRPDRTPSQALRVPTTWVPLTTQHQPLSPRASTPSGAVVALQVRWNTYRRLSTNLNRSSHRGYLRPPTRRDRCMLAKLHVVLIVRCFQKEDMFLNTSHRGP